MQNRILHFLYFVLLFLLQIILCNYLNLGVFVFFCFLPLFILNIPLSTRPAAVMLIAFSLGLLFDLLTQGLLGLNAAACTALAFSRKFIYRHTARRDRQDKIEVPDMKSIGTEKYLFYLLSCVALYVFVYVILEGSGTSFWILPLWKFVISTIVNTALCLLFSRPLINED